MHCVALANAVSKGSSVCVFPWRRNCVSSASRGVPSKYHSPDGATGLKDSFSFLREGQDGVGQGSWGEGQNKVESMYALSIKVLRFCEKVRREALKGS